MPKSDSLTSKLMASSSQLREVAAADPVLDRRNMRAAFVDAADEIDRLGELLRNARRRSELITKLDQSRKEIERLRAALEKIRSVSDDEFWREKAIGEIAARALRPADEDKV